MHMTPKLFSQPSLVVSSVTAAALLLFPSHARLAAQQDTSNTYKIGVIGSVTGPGSFIGDPFSRAAKLAVDNANAAGGINGKQIVVVSYDTEASPDKSLVFAKKLIYNDKVSIILGPDLSGTVRAVLPTTDEAGIPVLFNTPVIEPKPGSFHFTPWPSEETSYRVALQALQQRGVKKLAVLATTDVTGESGMQQIRRLAVQYGVTIVVTERMNPQDKDVTTQFTNIRAVASEAIFFMGSGATIAVVCKGYIRLAMNQMLVISTGAVSASFPELLKGITPNALIFPTYKMLVIDDLPVNDSSRAPIEEFAKVYEAKTGKKADFFGGAGWDLAHLAIYAMKKVGNDRTKIRDAVQEVKNFPATMAMLSFSPEEHRGAGPDAQIMGQFKDGRFLLLR
jgi:branched-chain amino acid transport system substrate-binding protein